MQVENKAGGVGICFLGRRSQTNLVRDTLPGSLALDYLTMEPDIYLCGIFTAVAGHMFIPHATDE